jgi:U3 small nucleolar RNA-associated protein 12
LKCEFTKSSNKKASKSDDLDENDESSSRDEKLLECKIACLLQNNQIEVYLLELTKQINDTQMPEILYSISMPGHRTDVRTICFSSDSTAFATASGDSMKIWNRMSLSCIRTFNCDYALSSLFLSDDSHVLLGTKVSQDQLF